jgi:RNA polymerase-interacting CarD/CdnL/TRCF family regulator
VTVDELVSADKDEVTNKSYPVIGKIDDGITVRVPRTKIKEINVRTLTTRLNRAGKNSFAGKALHVKLHWN